MSWISCLFRSHRLTRSRVAGSESTSTPVRVAGNESTSTPVRVVGSESTRTTPTRTRGGEAAVTTVPPAPVRVSGGERG